MVDKKKVKRKMEKLYAKSLEYWRELGYDSDWKEEVVNGIEVIASYFIKEEKIKKIYDDVMIDFD